MIAGPLLAQVEAQLAAITAADAATAGPSWGGMHKLLVKAKVDAREVMSVIGSRDLPALRRMVAVLRGDAPVDAPAPTVEVAAAHQPDHDTMQNALRVFRRRLKFAQLDVDSKLGVGPMTGGGGDRISAIEPPREYPFKVWEALVLAGKLRREGDGFYSLVPERT